MPEKKEPYVPTRDKVKHFYMWAGPSMHIRGEEFDRWLESEIADALAPAECIMLHVEPYDFGQCETHDTTFALGEECKFNGKEPWEVYADEADKQRGLKVRAQMEFEEAQWKLQEIETLMDNWATDSPEGRALIRSVRKRLAGEEDV